MAIGLRVERTVLSSRFIFLIPWRHISLTHVLFFRLICLLRIAFDLERGLVHGGFWLFAGRSFEINVGGVDVSHIFLLPVILESNIRVPKIV